jgi:diaminopimelate decarboxylase
MHRSLVTDELLRPPLSLRGEHLFIEDCDTVGLAEQFGTPLYVVSESQLRHNVRHWQTTFEEHWRAGPVRLYPSLKANPVVAIRRVLSDEDTGCDIFGPGELECAIRAGVTGEDLSVNGSIKDRALIRKALEHGARIILDSPREIELCEQEAADLGTVAKVLLRLKPDIRSLKLESDFAPGMQVSYLTQIIKYGIPTREALEMAARIGELEHVEPIGVHAHMGRHSKHPEIWEAWVRACIKLTREVSDAMGGWSPDCIDVGGGFPSPLDRDPDVAVIDYETPALEVFASTVGHSLQSALVEHGFDPEGLRLELEPGRGIHADTGIHLTSVVNVKSENVGMDYRWAEIDTAETFLDGHGFNLERPIYDYFIANRMAAENVALYDIVGQTCNAEILTHQLPAPSLEPGDLVAFLNTGAYGEPNAANFNALPRPGMVLVNGMQAAMVRRAETVDDVFARDELPEWLSV